LTYYFIIQDSIINKAIEGVNRKGKLKQYRNVKNNHFNDSTIIYGIKNRKSFIQIAKNDTLIKEVDTGFHFLTNKLYAVYVWDKIIDTNFHLISKEKLHHFYEFWNGYGNTPSINGVVTYYFKNSNIKKIVRITNSKRNGKVEFFNRKGQLRKIKIYKLGEKTEVIKIDK
jgi:antitoxin component YwqK of YwqJK toxin-antitoxin module